MIKAGYHVSAAGGLYKAFKEAKALTCEVIQIYVGSPRGWATPSIPSEADIKKFKEAQKEAGVEKVLVHAAYLPNPSSHKVSLRNFSLKKMKDEAKIAYSIGADGYNFHCGSNQDGNKEGIKHAINSLNRLAELTNYKWPVELILESDAGAGNRIGDTIEELGAIWKGLKNKKRFGICLDTCHLFVSGLDVGNKKVFSKSMKQFDKLIGLENLKFFHINDAMFDLGSKKDRHEHIGKGYIGKQGFKNFLSVPGVKKVPMILETPRSGDVKKDIKDIQELRKLAK
ncbi:MAG: deoxyribonuclease IV [Patescibacteria group bacterium]|nr:deoxyribonuclease IV [Patescibacteria group bacterium]